MICIDRTVLIPVMLITGLLFGGCVSGESDNSWSTQEVEMAYGEAECAFTGDSIETVRYGGRIDLEGGQRLHFMSVECLAGFYLGLENRERVRRLQVVDFTHGKRLMDVDQMVFLHSRLRPSPNGLYLTAIEEADEKMVTYIYDAYPGPLLNWEEVLELVTEEWELNGSKGTASAATFQGGAR